MNNKKKTLTLVIPMYNEEERISLATEAILAGFKSNSLSLKEIVMVNDGSRDKTLTRMRATKKSIEKVKKIPVKIVSYSENMGKGYAVRQGMLAAKSEYALLLDVDMSTPLTELSKFDHYVKDGAQVVVGTRKNGESTVKVAQPRYRQIMGHVFTKITQLVTGMKVTDFTCGFKLFSKQAIEIVFPKTMINRWGYDAEILYIASLNGFEIKEKALYWYNDDRSRVSAVKDAIRTLKELAQIKINKWTGKYTTRSAHDNLITRSNAWAKEVLFS